MCEAPESDLIPGERLLLLRSELLRVVLQVGFGLLLPYAEDIHRTGDADFDLRTFKLCFSLENLQKLNSNNSFFGAVFNGIYLSFKNVSNNQFLD